MKNIIVILLLYTSSVIAVPHSSEQSIKNRAHSSPALVMCHAIDRINYAVATLLVVQGVEPTELRQLFYQDFVEKIADKQLVDFFMDVVDQNIETLITNPPITEAEIEVYTTSLYRSCIAEYDED